MNASRVFGPPPGVPPSPRAGGVVTPAAAPAPQGWLGRWVDRLAQRWQNDPPGPGRVTCERPFWEVVGHVFGVEVGLTLSHLHQVRKDEGTELVHVIKPDGSSNLEWVVARLPVGAGQRLELQGPALNTSLTPGQAPLGARFLGVGLTGDLEAHDNEAGSYTLEVKITERTVAELAALAAPGAAAAAVAGLSGVANGVVGQAVTHVFAAAVPILSGALALASARRAYQTVRDPHRSKLQKGLAVAQAVADAVRVALPLAGTLASVGLVGVGAFLTWREARRAVREGRAGAAPPPIAPFASPVSRIHLTKG